MSNETNNRTTLITILAILTCALIGMGIYTYSLYNKNKELNNSIFNQNEKLNTQLDSINTLKVQVSENKIIIEHKNQDILRLESTIDGKNKEIALKEQEMKELEEKYEKIILIGSESEQMKKLVQELRRAREQRDSFRVERNKVAEEYNNLRKELIQKEQAIDILTRSTIPHLKEQVSILNGELEEKKKLIQIYNVRADISNIEINHLTNSIDFNLIFSNEDLYLLKSMNYNKLTFSPIIQNLDNQMYLLPSNPEYFTVNMYEAQPSIRIVFRTQTLNLKKAYKNKNAVNYEKGDRIKIEVKIDELNQLLVAQETFRLK